jgi:ferrous iron transport protein A
MKNRIFDFGIMENSPVIPLFTSPFGDPSAYLVKNAVVALRNNDCKDIIVTPE